MKKLFVGNLPFSVTEDELRDLFAQAGTVTQVSLISDRMSGRPKGFGFVEMETEDEAKKAVEMFNKYELNQRQLVVDIARPMTDRPERRRDRY